MTRTAALLAATLVPALALAADPRRPDVVMIVADDLGWADVGWHGGSIPTPNLDRLAGAGVRLEQHYVAPVCSPTRAALMTGRYWSRFGVANPTNDRVLPFETYTLARAFQDAGYATAQAGKWHLGSRPDWGPHRYGFDHGYGSLAGGVGPYDHRYKNGPFTRTWHRDDKLIDEEGHVTDLIAAEAVRRIESAGDRPLFLYAAFTAPHIPIREPDEWLAKVGHIGDPSQRLYAACVAHLDDAVGQIVGALERAGRLQDTLLIFTSDNGATPDARNDDPAYPPDDYQPGPCGGRNAPLRGRKATLYEGGIRVPAFVHWPARLESGVLEAPVHAVDWMPTLCGILGQAPPAHPRWDGRDLSAALLDGAEVPPRALYWVGPNFASAALRDGDWKLLVRRGEPERIELFDLAADPNETTDLAGREPGRVAALRRLLDAEAARDRDAVVTPEG